MGYSREDRIQQIRECGQAIIDNAESIYGSMKYPQGLSIVIEMQVNELPVIAYKRNFLPDGTIDKLNK